MNETLKTIAERFSCRNYTGELIQKDFIEAIGHAGLQAPSTMNLQQWEIIAIQNKELLDEMDEAALEYLKENHDDMYQRILGRGGKVFYNSACLFLILTPENAHQGVSMDVGIVAQNLTLAAKSLELGSGIVYMSTFPFMHPKKGEYLKEKIGWKKGYNFGIGVLVGHENIEPTPHEINLEKFRIVE